MHKKRKRIIRSCLVKNKEAFVSLNNQTSIQEVNENGIRVVELSKTSNFQGDELGIYGMEFVDLNDFTLRNKKHYLVTSSEQYERIVLED
ncbi:MAG: hypothetical protein MI975_14125 [Cytophagales bacterium]|nr:hypothetical protein [Cytophagales bacterium]